MLVIVSDLHFVDGTAGEHNLPTEAFKDVFLLDIAALAADKGVKKITLVLLGDIVDLIRSEQWLTAKPEHRPWGRLGLSDVARYEANPQNTPTAKQCLEILGRMPADGKRPPKTEKTILAQNWDTFAFFRDFKNKVGEAVSKIKPNSKIKVEIIYVPGNHDRMCNLYPQVRNELIAMLGLNQPVGGGGWFSYDYRGPEYGVYARHGHQYDVWNYAGGTNHDRGGQLKTPIGDPLTTEFAVKIPWIMETKPEYRRALTKRLLKNLKDIDNVRPASDVADWLYYRVGADPGWTRKKRAMRRAVDGAVDEVIKGLLKIKLVKTWRSPFTDWDEGVRFVASPGNSLLLRIGLDLTEGDKVLAYLMSKTGGTPAPEEDKYARAAWDEDVLDDGRTKYVVFGHTHRPVVYPLEVRDDREIIYINTGTWRTRIQRTLRPGGWPSFVGLKRMTYAVFYHAGEDTSNKKAGTVSFDVWNGWKKKQYR